LAVPNMFKHSLWIFFFFFTAVTPVDFHTKIERCFIEET
jgi:hypothetical protein